MKSTLKEAKWLLLPVIALVLVGVFAPFDSLPGLRMESSSIAPDTSAIISNGPRFTVKHGSEVAYTRAAAKKFAVITARIKRNHWNTQYAPQWRNGKMSLTDENGATVQAVIEPRGVEELDSNGNHYDGCIREPTTYSQHYELVYAISFDATYSPTSDLTFKTRISDEATGWTLPISVTIPPSQFR